jgi:hypothetical protein
MNLPPLIIECQHGLGDNIFARPFIRATAARRPVWLMTPWPELFEDLPVRFAPKPSRLRTQAKNIARQIGSRYSDPPPGAHSVKVQYGHQSLKTFRNIARSIEAILPLNGEPFVMDLPAWERETFVFSSTVRPIAVVRPVTARKEWHNIARNPLPEYVNAVAAALMKTHHVIAVADLQDGEEWLIGEMPPHHEAFVRGEMDVKSLLALFRNADVAVGGVGWIVPASIALKTKAFIIGGGQAQHNAPRVITDPRMDLSRIHFVTPEPQCPCAHMTHNCNKTIKGLGLSWTHFCQSHNLSCSPL